MFDDFSFLIFELQKIGYFQTHMSLSLKHFDKEKVLVGKLENRKKKIHENWLKITKSRYLRIIQ